ncbi:hypothetical protein H0X48_00095 [Candidatus Dependentiae bacterium]|nr:hypothetical protein [Candidatus Dependentiae bacterium]
MLNKTKAQSDLLFLGTLMAVATLTIFVHGTLFNFLRPFLFNFFYCPTGLTPAHEFDQKYYLAHIAPTVVQGAPHIFSLDTFYYFGWSGALSARERKKVAHQLYHTIIKLKEQYKATAGEEPCIRLIGHSHGGNIALNIAQIADKHKECSLTIEQLILLATPVQKETAPLVKHERFKQIYSFYSSADFVQRLDPQGLSNFGRLLTNKGLADALDNIDRVGPLFSERLFKPHPRLIQIKTRVLDKSLSHGDFLRLNFFTHLPKVLEWLETHPQKEAWTRKKYIDLELSVLKWHTTQTACPSYPYAQTMLSA